MCTCDGGRRIDTQPCAARTVGVRVEDGGELRHPRLGLVYRQCTHRHSRTQRGRSRRQRRRQAVLSIRTVLDDAAERALDVCSFGSVLRFLCGRVARVRDDVGDENPELRRGQTASGWRDVAVDVKGVILLEQDIGFGLITAKSAQKQTCFRLVDPSFGLSTAAGATGMQKPRSRQRRRSRSSPATADSNRRRWA